MEGLLLGSGAKHLRVSWAACGAALGEYWPAIRSSIIVFSIRLSARYGFAQSTKLCCPEGRFVSSALRPVSISSSTTPKP